MTSVGSIAAMSNRYVTFGMDAAEMINSVAASDMAEAAPEREAALADSVKVKKTDYPQGGHAESFAMDLKDPENIKPDTAVYDEKAGVYKVGTKLGDKFLSQPWWMTPEEYMKWSERQAFLDHFKMRNDSLFASKGKDKFDFTDMHFDLGPAEKIFGPGGVRVKTQGSAELKFGYNYKFTDDPSLSERNRTTKSFDFDEKSTSASTPRWETRWTSTSTTTPTPLSTSTLKT